MAGDLIGKVLGNGRYRIDSEIGGGGQAVVYRGMHLGLRVPVAIKILPEAYAQDDVLRGRFEREAHGLAQLRHPNIVGIYDFAVEEGTCYIVSEFIQGTDLKTVLSDSKGPLEVDKVSGWVEEIGDALQYAHDRDIMHRDVKPGNILIDGAGRRAREHDGSGRSRHARVHVARAVSDAAHRSSHRHLLLCPGRL